MPTRGRSVREDRVRLARLDAPERPQLLDTSRRRRGRVERVEHLPVAPGHVLVREGAVERRLDQSVEFFEPVADGLRSAMPSVSPAPRDREVQVRAGREAEPFVGRPRVIAGPHVQEGRLALVQRDIDERGEQRTAVALAPVAGVRAEAAELG